MSKSIEHPPLSIANRLFLVFLFGMVMVIGCLVLLKRTPLQAQSHPLEPAVVVHVTDQTISVQQTYPSPLPAEAMDVTHH